MTPTTPTMLTAEQVATMLGIHTYTVYRLIREGKLVAHNLSLRARRATWRISPSAVQELLKGYQSPVPVPKKPRSYHRRSAGQVPSEETCCCGDGTPLARLA